MGEIEKSRVPVPVNRPIETLDGAYRMAQNLALAQLLPTALRGKPSDVFAMILYGQDLGLSPMQAIQGIYVVEGRPSLAAQTWLALARRDGHRIEVVSHSGTECTVKLTRGDTGEIHTSTYTLEDAVAAGRVTVKEGKPVARSQTGKVLPWEAHTKSMLLARAVSAGCRFLMPEIALGFYTPDEAEEAAEAEAVVVEAVREQEREPGVEPETVQAELAELVAEYGPEVVEQAGWTCPECEVVHPATDEACECLPGGVPRTEAAL
jgi:hypothetical protein